MERLPLHVRGRLPQEGSAREEPTRPAAAAAVNQPPWNYVGHFRGNRF